jgi:hypothetical protein
VVLCFKGILGEGDLGENRERRVGRRREREKANEEEWRGNELRERERESEGEVEEGACRRRGGGVKE